MNSLPSAVFLDRDGTIIEDAHYLSSPEQVALIEGAAAAIARVNALAIPVVVVTNQSGIGRGLFTAGEHSLVTEHIDQLLASRGAHVDAWYFCAHAPEERCECRKPGVLLFRQAAVDLSIDLSRALYVGDKMRDIVSALVFGGQGVLVPARDTPVEDVQNATANARVAPTLAVAFDWFLCTN